VNANLFYEDYFNYQTPFSVPGSAVPLMLNSDYLHTRVAEDTTPSVVPTDEYGPYDALPAGHFTCTVLGITTNRCVTFTGESMIFAPKASVNATIAYDFVFLGGMARHSG
jgi:hypothetical protein